MGLIFEVVGASTSQPAVSDELGIFDPILEYAGTVAFAISGAMVAARRKMDIVGIVVLSCMVAVGGGTIRDLLLGLPVFWISDPTFVVVAALVALVAIPLHNRGSMQWTQRFNLINISDAAGMALFAVTSTGIALEAGANWLAAALVGVIAGVGGGIIRDMLANKIPDVLRNGQFYASAAFIGALAYVGLRALPVSALLIVWIPILLIFGIRMVSLKRGWGVPAPALKDVPVGNS